MVGEGKAHGLAVAEVRGTFQGLGNLWNEDIEALAFLVMMQAAKDAQSDLKNIMDGVKKTNQQKQGQRAAQNQKDAMSEMVRKSRFGCKWRWTGNRSSWRHCQISRRKWRKLRIPFSRT